MSENLNFETETLPAIYAHRDADGRVQNFTEPCYLLLSPCFLGNGITATFYDEGETVRTSACPNHHMQPLNSAAGERYARWLEEMAAHAGHGAVITIEDMVQASAQLSAVRGSQEFTNEQWAQAVSKLALAIKSKRDNQLYGGLRLPDMADPATRVGSSKAPPMAGPRYVDPAMRGPGQMGDRASLFEAPKAQPNTKALKGKPAIGGSAGGPQPPQPPSA